MPDTYTETTKTSYGGNIKNSFKNMFFGFILFVASFVVLWINEGHNVRQIYKADYMSKNAIEISAEKINRENDNKLVQLSGNATTNETLSDGIITIPNTFALKRKVEMYQWREDVETEKKENIGGSTTETKTYSYEKVWSEDQINSDGFKKSGHNNPKFTVKSENHYAQSGKLGGFKLTQQQAKAMSEYLEYANLPQKSGYQIYGSMYYKSYNPVSPSIGDIRISYEYVPSGVNISIIGEQKADNTITSLALKKMLVYLQQSGLNTKEEMINIFRKGNMMFTYLIRFVGWLIMFIGLNLLVDPLVTVFKILPILSNAAGFLTGGIMFLVSLVLSLLTIAVAWFAYRPVLSICLIAVICGLIFMIKNKYKKSSN